MLGNIPRSRPRSKSSNITLILAQALSVKFFVVPNLILDNIPPSESPFSWDIVNLLWNSFDASNQNGRIINLEPRIEMIWNDSVVCIVQIQIIEVITDPRNNNNNIINHNFRVIFL